MIADTGARLYGSKASADLFGLTKDDLIEQVKYIITAGSSTTLPPTAKSSSPERTTRYVFTPLSDTASRRVGDTPFGMPGTAH
jgi:hypothetical protein